MDADTQRRLRASLSMLLADDDDALRESLVSFFLAQGFKVFPAGSGPEAVEVAVTNNVRFSVMDVNMPGLSGIDALKTIAARMGAMPCIFMSGDASKDILFRALEVGGFAFLSKPIQIELMKRSVDQLVQRFFFKKR